jgi:hypothetical protein
VSIAPAANGQAIVGGTFGGTVSLGGPNVSSTGLKDSFVMKVDDSGGVVWRKVLEGSGGDALTTIALDQDLNIWLIGAFQGTLALGTSPTLSAAFPSLFVVKLDPDGNYIHDGVFQSSASATLAVDRNGDAVIGGDSWSVDFGGGTISEEAFIGKLHADGSHAWSKAFATIPSGKTCEVYIYRITTDATDNILITGGFRGTCDFVGETLTATSQTYEDVFVAKLDGDGNRIWVRNFGGDDNQDIGDSISTDAAGNVFVAGLMSNSFSVGSCTVSGPVGSWNTFALKFNPSGECVWAKGYAGTEVAKVTATPSGTAVVARVDRSSAPGAMIVTEHAAGDGEVLRESRFLGNGSGKLKAMGLACADDGSVFTAGAYAYSFDVGGNILPSAPPDGAAFAAVFAP